MAIGKQTGFEAKDLKDKIGELTSKIEEIRQEKALWGMVDASGNIMKSEEEDSI